MSQSQLEDFQFDAQQALGEVGTFEEAANTIQGLAETAKSIGVTEDDIPELFEQHFGKCVNVDDALAEAFPTQFGGR